MEQDRIGDICGKLNLLNLWYESGCIYVIFLVEHNNGRSFLEYIIFIEPKKLKTNTVSWSRFFLLLKECRMEHQMVYIR